MNLRLPDFLIGGAPRSGTTWLYELLNRHPQVYLAKPVRPEPKFFLADSLYQRGLQFYSQTWFFDTGGATMAGEKTTNYLESAQAAARIHRSLPGVKLVFILREPVDRAVSNYLWSRMNGMEQEDFATALEREEEREREAPEAQRYSRPYAYFSRGLYAAMLRPYLERFPRNQVLCLRYDDIIRQPAVLATRLHQFLGVELRPEDASGLGVVNPSRRDEVEVPEAVRCSLHDRYTEANRELSRLLGREFEIWEEQ